MKVVIIEDEKIAAANLAAMLQESGMDIEIVALLDSVKRSVEWFSQHTADLVFMDIQLGDGLSFSIFGQTDLKAPVIFTTAYDQYAVRAFKVNSIDYLLKPVEKAELQRALEKYAAHALNNPAGLSSFIASFNKPAREYQKRFMVSNGNRIRSVETEQVVCFYSEGRYVSLLLNDGNKYITDYTLEKLETLLDPTAFFRINRSTIIHFPAISQMHAYTKSRIKIELKKDPGFDVIVSIDRSGDFKKWLNR